MEFNKLIPIFLVFLLSLATVVASGGVVISPDPAYPGTQMTCSMTGGGSGYNYYWYKNGAFVTSSQSTSAQSVGDTYVCQIKKTYPQVGEIMLGEDSIVIQQQAPVGNQAPVASFTSNTPVVEGNNITFTDTSTDDSGVVAWLWDFGDLSASPTDNETNQIHLYAGNGTYTVTLTVWDAQNLSDSFNAQVQITTTCPAPASGDWTINGTQNVYCDGVTLNLDNIYVDDNAIAVFNNSNLNISSGMDIWDNADVTVENSDVNSSIRAESNSVLNLENTNTRSLYIGPNVVADVSNSNIATTFSITVENDYTFSELSELGVLTQTIYNTNLVNTSIGTMRLNLEDGNFNISDSNIGRVNADLVSSLNIVNSILSDLDLYSNNNPINVDNSTIDYLFFDENSTINFTSSTLTSELIALDGEYQTDLQQIYGDLTILPGVFTTIYEGIASLTRFYPVTVVNETGPLNGAEFNITNTTGHVLFNGATDSNGYIEAELTFDDLTYNDVYEIYVDGDLLGNIGLLTSTPILYNLSVSNSTIETHDIGIATSYINSVNGIRITDQFTTDITDDPANLTGGETYTIRYRTDNLGSFAENFTDTIIIYNQTGGVVFNNAHVHLNRIEGSQTTDSDMWDTTGLPEGQYNITVNASIATFTDVNLTDNYRTRIVNIIVSGNPLIENVTATPGGVNQSQNVILSADVTDPDVVSAVWVDVCGEYPFLTNVGGNTWSVLYNTSNCSGSPGGTVVYYDIYANDTLGNIGQGPTDAFLVFNSTANANPQIIASTPADGSSFQVNILDNVMFNITVIDPEGSNMSANWTIEDDFAAMILNQSTPNFVNGSTTSFNYTFNVLGNFTVEVAVYDNLTGFESGTWYVEVVNSVNLCNPPGSGTWVINGTQNVYCDGITLNITAVDIEDNSVVVFNNSDINLTNGVSIFDNADVTLENSIFRGNFFDTFSSSILNVINSSIPDLDVHETGSANVVDSTISTVLRITTNTDYSFSGINSGTLTETIYNTNLVNTSVNTIFVYLEDANYTITNSNFDYVSVEQVSSLNISDSTIDYLDLWENIISPINVDNSTLVNLNFADNSTINFIDSYLTTGLSFSDANNVPALQRIYGNLTINLPIALAATGPGLLERHYPTYVYNYTGLAEGLELNITNTTGYVLFNGITDSNGYVDAILTFDNSTFNDVYDIYVDGGLRGSIDLLTSTPIIINIPLDVTPPNVFDLIPLAESNFNTGDVIEISANVTDLDGVDLVYATILSPELNSMQVMLTNTIGDKYNNSYNLSLSEAGQYTVTFVANDTLGNINNTQVTFFVGNDNEVPQVFPISPTNVDEDIFVNYTVAYTDNIGVTACDLTINGMNGSAMILSGSPTNGIASRIVQIPSPGVYQLVANCTDASGNYNDTSVTTVTINDITKPEVSTIQPISADEDTTINFNATIFDYSSVTACNLYVDGLFNGTMTLAGDLANGSVSFNNPGTYDLLANCTDAAGNYNDTSVTTITINDITAPIVNILSPLTQTYKGTAVLINLSAADTYDPSPSVWYNIDGGNNFTYNGSVMSQTLSNGTHTLYAFASDLAGNINSANRTFTLDTTGSLGGVVRDQNSALLDNVDVSIGTWSTLTSAGVYNITSITPGTYSVTANLTGYLPQTVSGIAIQTNQLTNVDFTLTETGGIIGTVVEFFNSSTPIQNANVSATYVLTGEVKASYITDSNGDYELLGLMPGNYSITVTHSIWTDVTDPQSNHVLSGQNITRDFYLWV